MRWLVFLCRPFGVALGLFIVVNFLLALKEPRLAVNTVWLSVPIREPWLSVFALTLALALLAPHSAAGRSRFRLLQAGIFLGFAILALANVLSYYRHLGNGQIASHALFPFSALIVLILVAENVRVLTWRPPTARFPRPARRFFGGILVAIACFAMTLAHIYTFGMTDYSEYADHADAVVILGAKVGADGRMSTALADRMRTGVGLFQQGVADYLILSGGIDASGQSEPAVMARYAVEHGVPPERIVVDEEGANTYNSAKNCATYARRLGFTGLFVVSQYFHNARVKLIFERAGLPCYTVPAVPQRRFRREKYFLIREAVAFPYYLLFHQD